MYILYVDIYCNKLIIESKLICVVYNENKCIIINGKLTNHYEEIGTKNG